MKYLILLACVSLAGSNLSAIAQSDRRPVTEANFGPGIQEKRYLLTHQEADPRFILSMERNGPCEISGRPLKVTEVRVPWQIYPAESVAKHEEGTVRMQFIFDSDWCVRKATITQSSGFWRLDRVSLQYAMNLKFQPSKPLVTAEGEPTINFPIEWGASQRGR